MKKITPNMNDEKESI